MFYLLLIFAVIFLGSQGALSLWWGHGLASIFALLQLHRVSSNSIFLIFLAAIPLATEAFISLERFLLAAGFISWALTSQWLDKTEKEKKWFFIALFTLVLLLDFGEVLFTEKGSIFLWVAVFWAIYYENRSHFAYLFLAPFTLISNKVALMFAYVASCITRFKSFAPWLISAAFASVVFLFRLNIQGFLNKSVIPRLHIWHSCFEGFLNKPFTGHGFGNFALDISTFRLTGETWGTKAGQQLSHGHSLLSHMIFEQGLLGLALLVLIFYLIYKHCKAAFIPALIISLCDASAITPSQLLLASLLLLPFLKEHKLSWIKDLGIKKTISAIVLASALFIFSSSTIAHYHYSKKDFDKAIQFAPYNSLYYLSRGYENLNQDTDLSEQDFQKAVELSPNIGYFYGFLASAQLANDKKELAKEAIAKAIKYSGENAYWLALSAFIHIDDKDKSAELYKKAISLDPDIEEILLDKGYTSNIFLGGKRRDSRVVSFHRYGPKLFLPLPIIDRIPSFWE